MKETILYIITSGDNGGAQKYVLTLAKYFKGIIAVGTESSKLLEDANNLQLTTYKLKHLCRKVNLYHDLLAIWEIRSLIKKLNPDIVHLNSSKAGILGSFASMGLKTKIIFTAHGFIFNEPMSFWKKKLYVALEKIASYFRDYIICVSNTDKQSAIDNNLIARSKIITIHNGIGSINFYSKEEARAHLNLPTDKFLICTLANFYFTKGLDILIQSVSELSEEIKNKTQFILIGDGPERKNLEIQIKNNNLQNNIKLLGRINNADKYLKAFNLFILPSRKEGFPFAILEAMQAGLPIIYSNVGGIYEALKNAGKSFEPENYKALAELSANVITDSQLQKSLSLAILEEAKNFTKEKMISDTKIVYQKLLSQKI